MSGSAALSAARKRRASGAPMAGSAPTSQPVYNGRAPYANEQSTFIQPYPQQLPGSGIPPKSMNIYENIELIKQQLVERMKLIQTQGGTLSAERLAVLQKQNEIQTQILKQKIAIAKQLEMTNPEQAQMLQRVSSTMATSEPEFIYEKGVPRRNPNYNSGSPVFQKAPEPPKANASIKPFVSMISDTGVIPPPIVILKSHDTTLEEHHHILTNVLHQLDELHEQVKTGGASSNSVHVQQPQQKERTLDTVEEGDEGDEEEELLMDVVMNDLTNSREFVEGIVNKIVNETNLSEVIMKIEPLVKENQELRSLIHSQQQMMNEMNTMLLRLLNQNNSPTKTFQDNGLDSDGLYLSETTEIVISEPIKQVGNSGMDETMDSSFVTSVDAHTEATEVAHGAQVQLPQEENNDNHTTEGIVNNDSQQQPQQPQQPQDEELESAHDQDDDYSSPHFPTDPVSLIVQEIQ